MIAAVLVAVGLALVVGAEIFVPRWQLRQTGHVTVPSASASPEAVVRAYIQADDAHDERASRAMETPRFARQESRAKESGPAHLRILRVYGTFPGPASEATAGYAQVQRVMTDIEITDTWSIFGSRFDPGPEPRDFTMVRDRDSEPWRVAEFGSG
ncbi:MAG: hypothetical protein QOJ50_3316 [Cryptosporangiaceae bacterium]|nr:hypothetical protein [Cryptosporangiaceae bacterium]